MRKLLILVMVPMLFTLSCNQSGFGIFYSIESEEPLVNRDLADTVTVPAIAKAEGAYGAFYVIAAGDVYLLDAADTADQWTKIAPPETGMLSSSLAVYDHAANDQLYAVYYGLVDGTFRSTLYRYDFAASDPEWVEVDDALLLGEKVVGVVAAGSGADCRLFVTVQDGSPSYNLVTYNGLSFATDTATEVTGVTRIFTDAAYDGAEYWLTNKSVLLSGTPGAWTMDAAITGDITGLFYTDVYADAAVYAATAGGSVWKNTGTWVVDTTDLGTLTDFALVSRDATDIIGLGSESGYYETSTGSGFAAPDPDVTLSTNANYANLTLKSSVVLTFYADTNLLFAGTAGMGLWKNVDGAWSIE